MKEREIMIQKMALIAEIDKLYIMICGARLTAAYTAELLDKSLLTLWYKKERLEAVLAIPVNAN